MKLTTKDIKRLALEKIGSGVSSFAPETDQEVNVSKLASQLKSMSGNASSDDVAFLYLEMIKEAHYKAREKLGLGERLSLR